MIKELNLRPILQYADMVHAAANSNRSAIGASITIKKDTESQVIFITGVYGAAAVTQISEGGANTGLTPSGSLNYPYLRFDADVVITGGATTVVTYFKVNGT